MVGLARLVLLFIIANHSCTKLQGAPTAFSYSARIEEWMKEFQNDDKICYSSLRQKMLNDARSMYIPKELMKSADKKAAARIVYLYTYAAPCFYGELNKQLRNTSVLDTFKTYADLLNEAISMLSSVWSVRQKDLYRGTDKCDEINGKGLTTLRGFTSTSEDPTVPFNFKCDIYIVFTEITGVPVKQVSTFGNENEVILPTNYKINVVQYITDSGKAQAEVREHAKQASTAEIQKVKIYVLAVSADGNDSSFAIQLSASLIYLFSTYAIGQIVTVTMI